MSEFSITYFKSEIKLKKKKNYQVEKYREPSDIIDVHTILVYIFHTNRLKYKIY